MFDYNENTLSFPKGTGQGIVSFDMKSISQAESRLHETSFVTAIKSPELQYLFNKAALDTSRYLAEANFELKTAQNAAKRTYATVLLDKVPEVLTKRGIVAARGSVGTADQREAVIEMDTDYQSITDIVAQLEAIVSFLEGKLDAFERAYYSAKKVMDSTTQLRSNPYLELENNGQN